MSSWLLIDHNNNRSFKINIPSTSSHNVSHTVDTIIDPTLSCHHPRFVLAKGDSAASGHFIRPIDAHVLDDVKEECGTTVTLPDNDVICSSHSGQLPNVNLPRLATKASVLPQLASSSLISLPQLCDHGCQCLLTKDSLTVIKNGKFVLQGGKGTPILHGVRNPIDKLWDIPLQQSSSTYTKTPTKPFSYLSPPSQSSSHQLNVIIRKKQLKQDLAKFLHGALFSPRYSTLKHAIQKNFLSSFPGLTEHLFNKHLPTSIATELGHLRQEKQHLQSTSQQQSPEADFFPPQESKTNDVIYAITSYKEREVAAADLTGRFPYKSSRGNQYVMIMYHYDPNVIWGIPLKSRNAGDIVAAWKHLHKKFLNGGFKPNLFIFDNEFSGEFRSAVEQENITLQLVTPHMHRTNPAERAIQTWKDHFLAGLASTHPDFPMKEWDRLILQCNITLNLLRASRIHPQLSAYASLFGNFDYSRTPMAPPGTKLIFHNKTGQRPSWGFHGQEGWYIGPALDHYRNILAYFPDTRSEKYTDTVTFLPHSIPIPTITMEDYLLQAVDDIISILKSPSPTILPTLKKGNATRNAILEIATMLKTALAPPSPLPTTSVPEPRVVVPINTTMPEPRVEVRKNINPITTDTYTANVPDMRLTNSQRLQALKDVYHNKLPSLKTTNKAQHIYDSTGKKLSMKKLLAGPDADVWTQALSNEFGRLTKGNKAGVSWTDTMEFIRKTDVPTTKKVTYCSFVCDIKPHKQERYRVRLVVGGDKLECEYDTGAPAASLFDTKILCNSIISDAHKGARFANADIKDFFLMSYMEEPEFMRIAFKYFPADIIVKYNLQEKMAHDGYIYIKIKRGMYGLKQAAILAHQQLIANLTPHGYHPIPNTNFWRHETRPTIFCLCVDDFGIKYFSKADANHLFTVLAKHYQYTVDWEGTNFCGYTLDWHYDDGFVDLSMPNYIPSLLKKLHYSPEKIQHSPHEFLPLNYGTKTRQLATQLDTSPLLNPKETTYVQSIIGSLLYHARALDGSLLPALNSISAQQNKPTQKVKEKCTRLLDYVATYPHPILRFYASDMILTVESDAAYLVLPKARSRAAGFFYLHNYPTSKPHPTLNGAILVECTTLRHVVSSAAEAEVGALYHNVRVALPIKNLLEAIGHSQNSTIITTDNSTAHSFVYDNIHQKRSKSWDMRFYWLRDRMNQKQFIIKWAAGKSNKADYYTKHHPIKKHTEIRQMYNFDGDTPPLTQDQSFATS